MQFEWLAAVGKLGWPEDVIGGPAVAVALGGWSKEEDFE